MITIELTDEQRKMISSAIKVFCMDVELTLMEINNPIYDNRHDIEDLRQNLTSTKLKYQTLLNYIEQV